MTEALLTFSRMVAWSALFLASFAIVINTYARIAETPEQAIKSKIEGETWRSRLPFFVVAALGAMWLYASWGTG